MNDIIVPQGIQERARQRVDKFSKTLRTPQPSRVEGGQIWATHAIFELAPDTSIKTKEPRLVVIVAGEGAPSEAMEGVTAAPISLATSMATDLDLLVPASESSLEFSFMVEVWNETPALKGHLRKYLGALSDEAVAALRAVYRVQLGEQELPDRYISWVGLPIMGQDDGRLAFQEEEVRACSYLAKASTAALGLVESAQEAEVAERASTTTAHTIFTYWKVNVPAEFRRISDVLHPDQIRGERPPVAYAAGEEEDETLTFLYNEDDERRFLLELINSRRPPYRVYLLVRMVSKALAGNRSVVTVVTKAEKFTSEPVALEVGSEIVVGEDPYFERDTVERIEVVVEK